MVLPLSCLGWHGNTFVKTLTISITFALLIEMATQEALILYSIKRQFSEEMLTALFNPLNAKLNPICHLLALLGNHPILHVSSIRVK
jgi:hypothetical protein